MSQRMHGKGVTTSCTQSTRRVQYIYVLHCIDMRHHPVSLVAYTHADVIVLSHLNKGNKVPFVTVNHNDHMGKATI